MFPPGTIVAGLECIGELEIEGRVGVGSPEVIITAFGGGVILLLAASDFCVEFT